MRKKILFIVPPCLPIEELFGESDKVFSTTLRKEIPLGALTLASYMQCKTDAEVLILDVNLKFYQMMECKRIVDCESAESALVSLVNQYKGDNIDIIGISAIFNPTYEYIDKISRICKAILPNALCFAGGGVPSNMIKEVFRDAPYLDFISYGEGEIGISGIINTVDEDDYISNSKSIITRKKIQEHFSYEFEIIENLDEIPPINYDLIDLKEYNSHARGKNGQIVNAVPLMLSRGCPFRCCFCSSHSIHGRRVRYNSMNRIMDDVKGYVEKYKANTLEVWDDNFFADKEKAYKLLDFFEELDLNVDFVNGFPVYQMDDTMAARLKRAGVNVITFAIESGCSRVLKEIIHKPLKLDMVPKAIECVRKYGMYTIGLFVIGFPGETKEELQETMDFIHSIDLNWVSIFAATPLPGSELYERCLDGNYLKTEGVGSLNYYNAAIETEEFNPDYIEKIQIYNNIKKNYVENLDMKNHNYERALVDFERVMGLKFINPFAYYYAAVCAKKLGDNDKYILYSREYLKTKNQEKKWINLIKEFDLGELELGDI